LGCTIEYWGEVWREGETFILMSASSWSGTTGEEGEKSGEMNGEMNIPKKFRETIFENVSPLSR